MLTQTRSLGIIRKRFDTFNQYKKQISQKQNRFKKQQQAIDQSRELESQSLLNSKTQTLLTGKPESSQSITENQKNGLTLMDTHSKLPPIYIDIYEETLKKLNEAKILYQEIKKATIARIKCQFEQDQQQIDIQLHDLTAKSTKLLKSSEENLKKIKVLGEQQRVQGKETVNDRQIRINIEKFLALTMSEITSSLRQEQKSLFNYLKNINSSNTAGFLQLSMEKQIQMLDMENEEQMHQKEVMEELAQDKDEEINILVKTINELTQLFKTLSEIVIEQGTLLDRIDYNIESALKEVGSANVQLVKAEKYQKSNFARKCMFILILLIVIFTFILVFKWT